MLAEQCIEQDCDHYPQDYEAASAKGNVTVLPFQLGFPEMQAVSNDECRNQVDDNAQAYAYENGKFAQGLLTYVEQVFRDARHDAKYNTKPVYNSRRLSSFLRLLRLRLCGSQSYSIPSLQKVLRTIP